MDNMHFYKNIHVSGTLLNKNGKLLLNHYDIVVFALYFQSINYLTTRLWIA